jgi:hypothetical protein
MHSTSVRRVPLALATLAAAAICIGVLVGGGGPRRASAEIPAAGQHRTERSGVWDQRQSLESSVGAAAPVRAAVAGHNILVNQDRSLFPHDETVIAVNPRNPLNIVAGANDYRLGYGQSGFYASQDGGKTWYDGIIPIPSWFNGNVPAGGGDPVVVFDADGVAYYVGLAFDRASDRSAVVVSRSNNGGQTWSRPSFASGDGIIANNQFADGTIDSSVDHDKEWAVVDTTSSRYHNRIYVTWTRFEGPPKAFASPIFEAHSDNGGRTWSANHEINGSSQLCDDTGGDAVKRCGDNQPSWPVVGPDGTVYVFFRNTNTPAENQFLMVKSTDGGVTFSEPVFVATDFDINYPTPGTNRPECLSRGQGAGRRVLSNSCFRVNSYGGPAVAPDGTLYLVWSDNRNGSPDRTSTDIFLVRSRDGGENWSDAIRVNTDPVGGGKDHWFPWMAVAPNGTVYVVFHDRRSDPNNYLVETWMAKSTDRGRTWTNFPVSDIASNWDYGFRAGLFMGDYSGLAVTDTNAYPFFTDARFGTAAVRRSEVFLDIVKT